jgi:hypothetical protein
VRSCALPNQVNLVLASRALLIVLAAAIAVLILGPFQSADHLFWLSDKQAHAGASFALTIICLTVAPRLRSGDLALIVLGLGAAAEVAHACVGVGGNLSNLMADGGGVLAAWAPAAYARSMASLLQDDVPVERRTSRTAASELAGGLVKQLRDHSAPVAMGRSPWP